MGRKGKPKSDAAKKHNTDLRKIAQIVAQTQLNDVGRNKLKRMGFETEKDITAATAMLMGQVYAGINGNEKAARFVSELLGTDAGRSAGADDPLTAAIKAEFKDGET